MQARTMVSGCREYGARSVWIWDLVRAFWSIFEAQLGRWGSRIVRF